MKKFWFLALLLVVILTACATPAEPPTPTPKPTWTLTPHGTFTGCIYFDGEMVNGFFDIYDENEEFVKNSDSGAPECIPVMLTPGFYWIDAQYWSGADCSEGCYPEGDMIYIEVKEGDQIEMDFIVLAK